MTGHSVQAEICPRLPQIRLFRHGEGQIPVAASNGGFPLQSKEPQRQRRKQLIQ